MKNFARKCLLIAAIAGLPLSPVFAVDIITKKSDGKKVNGTISGMSKTDLTLKRTGGEDTIPANDIALIEWDGGIELKLGYNDENKGRYEQANQHYLKAKADAKSPSEFLKGELEYVLARVAAKQGMADPEKRDTAIQKLQGAQRAYPDHIRYFESVLLLSQVQLAAKDFNGARSTLENLKKSPWSDMKLSAQIAEARVLISEGRMDEAVSTFDSAVAAAGDSPAEVTRRNEAKVGKAGCLIMQTKFDEGLKILEELTDRELTEKTSVEDSSVLAEAYVLQGRALQALGRNKEAALAYLHVDILFPSEAGFHAESLYQLSNIWKQIQLPDRSAEAAGKLVQIYPNSEWRKKLAGTQ